MVPCKMLCPSLPPSVSLSVSDSLTNTAQCQMLLSPWFRLLVQFCNSPTVSDCKPVRCQRVEVASYGMPFSKSSSERRHETHLWSVWYSGLFATCKLLLFSEEACKFLGNWKKVMCIQLFYESLQTGNKKGVKQKLIKEFIFKINERLGNDLVLHYLTVFKYHL